MTWATDTVDVFCAAVPDNINPADPLQYGLLVTQLDRVALKYTARQWDQQHRRPLEIRNFTSEWFVTASEDDIEKFQPAHDCAACRAGNAQAAAFLRDNPGRYIALANLSYTEIWADPPSTAPPPVNNPSDPGPTMP